jgi:hypothetical protein
VDFPGRSAGGYRKFVAAGPEVRFARGFDDLAHDFAEHLIAGGKSDGAFDLDLDDRRIATGIMGVYDNVV